MKEHNHNIDELQNEHMDELIRLAFKYENELVVEALVDEAENFPAVEEPKCNPPIIDIAWGKLKQEQKVQQKKNRKQTIRRVFPRFIEVAACIILILGIAAPIAVANNAYFRSKVMQFLLTFNENEGTIEVHFDEVEDAAFNVPVEWEGAYYLSMIPEGYTIVYNDSWEGLYFEILYENADKKRIRFIETGGLSAGSIGTENAEVSYIDVNGIPALIVVANDKEYIEINWSCEDRWLTLITEGIKYDETIKIVESIRRIIDF